MAHAMAAESHGLVEYDDGVLQLTKKSNIKEIANGGHVVKWGSAWYGVKVLCVGTEELCLAMYSSIKLKLPRVELQDIVQCKNNLTCFWEKTDSHCQGMIENDQSEEDPDLTEQNAEWNQLHQSPSGFSDDSIADPNYEDVHSSESSESDIGELNENSIVSKNEFNSLSNRRSPCPVSIDNSLKLSKKGGSKNIGSSMNRGYSSESSESVIVELNENSTASQNELELLSNRRSPCPVSIDNSLTLSEKGGLENIGSSRNRGSSTNRGSSRSKGSSTNIGSSRNRRSSSESSESDKVELDENSTVSKNDLNLLSNRRSPCPVSMDNSLTLSKKGGAKKIGSSTNRGPSTNRESPRSFLLEDANTFSPVVLNEITVSQKGKSKKYFCLFCKKLVTKFGRHILLCHGDEGLVKKIALLPKGSGERFNRISELRKKGTFLFNTRSEFNDGHLIVTRRPQQIRTGNRGKDYKACPSCMDFYSKKSIRRHYAKCNPGAEKGKKDLMPLSRSIQGQVHKKANNILRNQIFPRMRDDCNTDVIRFDELAIVYGNYLCNKYRKPHLQPMIRSKLRLVGRLLIVMKEIDNTIKDFSSIFKPKCYDDVIAAVNKVAILGEDNCYRSPATAFSYGTLLKKCSKLLVNECIKKEDEEMLKKCRDFQSIIEEDFASSVNKTVEENQKEMRRHKKVNLPSMDDVQKLKKYLDSNRRKCFDFLSHNSFCYEEWKHLAEYTLISVQMFNRRRAGEIERITIEDFNSYEAVNEDVDGDIFKSLTQESQALAKQYVRFEIRGKLGRAVPVLLHHTLLSCIQLILKKRKEAGVSDDNPYVFGIPGGKEKYLRACILLRKFSNSCGALQPQTLRGTELRKHIATHCVLLNLQEEEVDDLANFLGHANKIHKEHYRMPIVTRDIVRMSQLLEKAQGNCDYGQESQPDISVLEDINANIHSDQSPPAAISKTSKMKRSVSPTGRVKRVSWSKEERDAATDLFSSFIENGNLPSTKDCFDVIKENPVFRNRSPLQLKSWLSNQLMKERDNERSVKRRRVSTIYWSYEEKQLMYQLFKNHLEARTLPSFNECVAAITQNPILKFRSKETVKAWVFNENRRNRKI